MPILYIDGHCLICNGFVDFLIKRDRQKSLKFSNIQSGYALANLPIKLTNNPSSIVLQVETTQYTKSSAALRVISLLGGVYGLALAFLLIPPFLRDFLYGVLADNRYRLGAKLDQCPIIPKELQDRFLV